MTPEEREAKAAKNLKFIEDWNSFCDRAVEVLQGVPAPDWDRLLSGSDLGQRDPKLLALREEIKIKDLGETLMYKLQNYDKGIHGEAEIFKKINPDLQHCTVPLPKHG